FLRAGGNLAGDITADVDLLFVLFVAVGVREVDHHPARQAGFFQQGSGGGDAVGVVVGAVAAAAQDDVGIVVAGGGENGRVVGLVVQRETVRMARGADGVHGNLDRAAGAILEADRTGQAGY